MALASRIEKQENNIFVILGDGEIDEGSIWEAAIFISKYQFKNLTIIVDSNKLQGYDKVNDVFKYEKMVEMWKALDFDLLEIDGNDYLEIDKAIKKLSNKTKVVIANTIKGKGVSFIENKLEWHYKSPSEEQLKLGLEELREYENKLY